MIKMTISKGFLKDITSQSQKVQTKVFMAGQSALNQESARLVKELRGDMLAGKNGRYYKYKKGVHRASTGGEVLASRGGADGSLYKSLRFNIKSGLISTFRYNFYAGIWENKSGSNKRKFMNNKLLENKNQIANVVANRMSSFLKF